MPVATDGKVVLIGRYVGIGTDGYAEMLAKHSSGDFQDSVCVRALGCFLPKSIKEAQTAFILTQLQLSAPSFDGRACALGHFANEPDLFLRPESGLVMVEVKQRHKAAPLGDWHVDERLGADCLQRLRGLACALIVVSILTDDRDALFEVVDIGTIVAKMQHAGEAFDAGRVPVALDRYGLARQIDRSVAGATDIQLATNDLSCGVGQVLWIFNLPHGLAEVGKRSASLSRSVCLGDVESLAENSSHSAAAIIERCVDEG